MIFENEYKLALQAAKAAGDFLKNNSVINVDSQIDKDIKTSTDRESEKIILDILEKSNISVLSEECGFVGTKGVKCWIVDPLDGTANYWKGMRELACVSIALWENGKPVLGVINRFMTGEVYGGIVGEGAWLNDEPIKTSGETMLGKAFLTTGFPVKRDYSTESLERFVKQVQSFKKVRMLGAAAIMGALVAHGKIDAYTEEQIMLWDIAASSAIVQAAGGSVEIEMLNDSQCICRLFASSELLEEFKKL